MTKKRPPTDIFDTDHVDDLPQAMQKRLSRAHSYRRMVVELLEESEAHELTLAEIWVGLYRRFGYEASYTGVANALQRLIKQGVIRKSRRAYALPGTDERELAGAGSGGADHEDA